MLGSISLSLSSFSFSRLSSSLSFVSFPPSPSGPPRSLDRDPPRSPHYICLPGARRGGSASANSLISAIGLTRRRSPFVGLLSAAILRLRVDTGTPKTSALIAAAAANPENPSIQTSASLCLCRRRPPGRHRNRSPPPPPPPPRGSPRRRSPPAPPARGSSEPRRFLGRRAGSGGAPPARGGSYEPTPSRADEAGRVAEGGLKCGRK